MNDNIIVPFIDLSTAHLQILFLVEWRMILQVCVNGFLEPQTDIKVTWLCDDAQLLSLQTNQSLQRSTSISDIFYALSLAGICKNLCEEWWASLSPWYRREGSVAADCSASAFSWKNTHLIAALRAAGLQMSQDTNERLVQHANKTAGASPTAERWRPACLLFPQLQPALLHSALHARKRALIAKLKGATFFLEQVCAFEGKLWQHLVPVCDQTETSAVWGRQGKTDDKVCRTNSAEGSKLGANPFQSWQAG